MLICFNRRKKNLSATKNILLLSICYKIWFFFLLQKLNILLYLFFIFEKFFSVPFYVCVKKTKAVIMKFESVKLDIFKRSQNYKFLLIKKFLDRPELALKEHLKISSVEYNISHVAPVIINGFLKTQFEIGMDHSTIWALCL